MLSVGRSPSCSIFPDSGYGQISLGYAAKETIGCYRAVKLKLSPRFGLFHSLLKSTATFVFSPAVSTPYPQGSIRIGNQYREIPCPEKQKQQAIKYSLPGRQFRHRVERFGKPRPLVV